MTDVAWLAVIGRSLARLCLDNAIKQDKDAFKDVMPRVDYLVALGLPASDAAVGAGSTPESVRVMRSQQKKKANGKKSKTKRKR